MKDFRIIQTQPLTHVLPYEAQEYRKVWYLPRPVWRTLKDFATLSTFQWPVAIRFQTPREARYYIENLLMMRVREQAERAQREEEQAQRQQLPRVIETLKVPVTA